jgi:hypothetical protein
VLWLALIVGLIQQIRQAAGGMPVVELSSHPLWPGKTCQLLFRWPGAPRLEELRLRLLCEEQVSFREGTDTRTEEQAVYVKELWEHSESAGEAMRSREVEREILVPLDAMHSFKADNNNVRWLIEVKGKFARWGAFKHRFPVIVCPRDPCEVEP